MNLLAWIISVPVWRRKKTLKPRRSTLQVAELLEVNKINLNQLAMRFQQPERGLRKILAMLEGLLASGRVGDFRS